MWSRSALDRFAVPAPRAKPPHRQVRESIRRERAWHANRRKLPTWHLPHSSCPTQCLPVPSVRVRSRSRFPDCRRRLTEAGAAAGLAAVKALVMVVRHAAGAEASEARPGRWRGADRALGTRSPADPRVGQNIERVLPVGAMGCPTLGARHGYQRRRWAGPQFLHDWFLLSLGRGLHSAAPDVVRALHPSTHRIPLSCTCRHDIPRGIDRMCYHNARFVHVGGTNGHE